MADKPVENSPRAVIWRLQAEKVIQALGKRGMDGAYCETREEAVQAVCGLVPAGSLVGLGGSETIVTCGLIQALRAMEIRLLDRYRPGVSKAEVDEMRVRGLQADVYITSSNAVTLDGQLVNMDGTGNRVAALVFGPQRVIVVAGMNKVVATLDDARTRIRLVAAPRNAIRVGADTPCSHTGVCQDPHCRPPRRICCQLVVTEASMAPGRIRVVLVGEELGF